ncbi:flavin reductase [Leucobacter sp. CSA1]|uniref:Flavin reductase n=1 Tax=Leucobacter chromiisoli TaxID=2796471 RepID=A0A934Q782_9MICO|nr:flavin reductase family protein [Leucobacter chromiisoli]MBK0417954.1 flavin reductase [Leucobacter chromiisoli]
MSDAQHLPERHLATQEAFKDAFREHPAGIALITAETADGPVGLTASSVASVGLDPLALAFSVTRATGSAGGILSAPGYVVHLLSANNIGIAETFARSGTERFTDDQGWERLPTGEPFLPAARVALRCRTMQAIPVGSSSLVLAEVLEVIPGEPGAVLVYQDRTFRTL